MTRIFPCSIIHPISSSLNRISKAFAQSLAESWLFAAAAAGFGGFAKDFDGGRVDRAEVCISGLGDLEFNIADTGMSLEFWRPESIADDVLIGLFVPQMMLAGRA